MGGVTIIASSFIYNFLSPIRGWRISVLNFEQLNTTNKTLLGVNKVDYRSHNWL